jgi:uncharacterized protein YuzE
MKAFMMKVSDEKPDHGEQMGEEIIIHFTKDNKLVKIEILDASKIVLDMLKPIPGHKSMEQACITITIQRL